MLVGISNAFFNYFFRPPT